MKAARVGLWAIGAAVCAVSIGFFFDDFGRGEQPDLIVKGPSNSAPALAASVTAAETPETDVLDPAAQESSHAIVPDTPQVTAPSPPAEATAPSTDLPQLPSADPPVKEASPSITSQPSVPAHPSAEASPMPKEELATIASAATIRNGPSSSADIIGRAHPGAKARVAATDSGWAQIVDPASGNKGWVESRFLAPSATTETAATDELPDVAAPDTFPEDQRAAMSENRPSATRSRNSAKEGRHRTRHHHGRHRFAFRFVILGF